MERRVVGSIALNVTRAGPPDGLLFILPHGLPEFWLEWRSLCRPSAAASSKRRRAGSAWLQPDTPRKGYTPVTQRSGWVYLYRARRRRFCTSIVPELERPAQYERCSHEG
jgi:hypothetical protein